MTNRPGGRPANVSTASSRAEARRRARLAASGRVAEPEEEGASDGDELPRTTKPGFLQRVLPPVPPLPGKGDPLADFTYTGPLRPVLAIPYLLAINPVAWLLPALIWMVAWPFSGGAGTYALIGSVAQYIALIAAGWVGWQRPWLYGVAAILVAWGVVGAFFIVYGTKSGLIAVNDLPVVFGSQTALQIVVGFVAGWYGGYLRRRLADQRATAQPQRRRR